MKKVIITGASGSLGRALAEFYFHKGWQVIGVTSKVRSEMGFCHKVVVSSQRTAEDAREILGLQPSLVILNAGQIETEIDKGGLPLLSQIESMQKINCDFPQILSLEAFKKTWMESIDIVAIGSIADSSPSCFGPVYHASKMALNYWITSVGPIGSHFNSQVKLRLYRPGVIEGPLSWSPVIRLNDRGYKIRARRCENAPSPNVVAKKIAKFIDSKKMIGCDRSPISFHILRLIFWLTPNFYCFLQSWSWRNISKFPPGEEEKIVQEQIREVAIES